MFLQNSVFCSSVETKQNKRRRENVCYSAVKIQPEDVHRRSVKVTLLFFPFFFFLPQELLFLSGGNSGWWEENG